MSRDLIQNIFQEAKAYEQFDLILQDKSQIKHLPSLALRSVIVNSGPKQIADLIPYLSKEQKETLFFIDFWKGDEINVEVFTRWIEAYPLVKDDDAVKSFVTSDFFLLFLKGRVNIWTFDVEDPLYPEHDNYFLTDDNLLLIEYDESFVHVSQLKDLLKQLYFHLGVEDAYSLLFKVVSESSNTLFEDFFQESSQSVRALGFPNYETLENIYACLPSTPKLNQFVMEVENGKYKTSQGGDYISTEMPTHHGVKVFMHNKSLRDLLSQLKDEKRLRFLTSNFSLLLNAVFQKEGAFEDQSSLSINRISTLVSDKLSLAISYLEHKESFFEYWDFMSLFKVAQSLIFIERRKIYKALKDKVILKDGDILKFYGDFIVEKIGPLFQGGAFNAYALENFIMSTEYKDLRDKSNALQDFSLILDFANLSLQEWERIKDKDLVVEPYFNVKVSDVDFEHILMTLFFKFIIKEKNPEHLKESFGLFLTEFQLVENDIGLENLSVFDDFIKKFMIHYQIPSQCFEYIQVVLEDHVIGNKFESLEEYKYMTGILLMNPANE